MINYAIEIYGVVDGDYEGFINNTSNETDYALVSLQMRYTILSSESAGSMVLIPKPLGNINNQQYYIDESNRLQEGQIIKIYKQWLESGSNNIISENTAFLGFIERIQYKKSAEGFIIIVFFSQLLKQFTILPSVQTSEEAENIGVPLPSIIGNKANLTDITNKFIANSLMAVAQNQSLYDDSAQVFNIDNRVPEQVYVYSDLNTSRDTFVRTAIQVWNLIMWQDESGKVYIEPLALNNIADSIWNIEEGNYISYEATNNSGVVLNQLIQFYMIPTFENVLPNATNLSAGVRTVITPNEQYFPRSKSLYDTKNYTVSELNGKSIDNNIVKNPQAFTYLSQGSGINNAFKTLEGSPQPVTQLYGQQDFARAMNNAYNFGVLMPVTENYIDNDLPLAQIVSINLNDYVLPNGNMLCVGASIEWSVDIGAVIMLQFTPVLSVSGLWVSGDENV